MDGTVDDTGGDNPTDDFAQSGTRLNDTVSTQNKKTKFTHGAGDDLAYSAAGDDPIWARWG